MKVRHGGRMQMLDGAVVRFDTKTSPDYVYVYFSGSDAPVARQSKQSTGTYTPQSWGNPSAAYVGYSLEYYDHRASEWRMWSNYARKDDLQFKIENLYGSWESTL